MRVYDSTQILLNLKSVNRQFNENIVQEERYHLMLFVCETEQDREKREIKKFHKCCL